MFFAIDIFKPLRVKSGSKRKQRDRRISHPLSPDLTRSFPPHVQSNPLSHIERLPSTSPAGCTQQPSERCCSSSIDLLQGQTYASKSRHRPPNPSAQIDDLTLYSPFDPRPAPTPPVTSPSSSSRQSSPSPVAQRTHHAPDPPSYHQLQAPAANIRRDSAHDEDDMPPHLHLHPQQAAPAHRSSIRPPAGDEEGDGDGYRAQTAWEKIGERRLKANGADGFISAGW